VIQIVAPRIAASMLSSRLSANGHVISVSVSAFPAFELLWHDADSVDVRMSNYHASADKLGTTLGDAGGVGSLHVSVGTLTSGLLTVHDVTLTKHGNVVTGAAQVHESDLRAALPGLLQSIVPVASTDGQLTLQGTVNVPLLGRVSADFIARTKNGKIVVSPDLPLLSSLAVTVWSQPTVRVLSVSGSPIAGGMSVSATASLQ
jgi:hypothetical protein